METKIIFILLLTLWSRRSVADTVNITKTKSELNSTLPRWKNTNLTQENHEILQERNEREQKLIDDVAVRGDALKEYRIQLRLMNLFMRKHHSEMRTRVGHNLYPLILALDVDHDKRLSGVGSEYILYLRNGTVMSMKPTPVEYETNKDLAHMALCIFNIISPFFKNPRSSEWKKNLKEYQNMIQSNIKALKESGLKDSFSLLCDENISVKDQETMLSMVNDYINDCFERGNVDIDGYKDFALRYRPYMQKALKCAAQMQVKSSLAALQRWKEQIGPELWRDVYVVIPVIWPVARVNPRQQIFEKLLDPDRTISHIIKAEGVSTIAGARELLGRIVADRSMAHFVFGSEDIMNTDSNLSLSTRRDVVATYGYGAVNATSVRNAMALDITASDLRYDEDGAPV